MLTTIAASLALLRLQTSNPKVARIIDEGKNHSQVMRTLRYLSENIGPRATGSPELERAEKWAMAEFKRYGCKNVHREQWDTVPGWQRGPRQVGRMVAPIRSDFQFTTNVWTDGTNGLVRGRAVANPKSLEDAKARATELRGAWVIMKYQAIMRGTTLANKEAKEITDFVNSCGIAGRIFGSKDEMVHTHGTFNVPGSEPPVRKTPESHPRGVEVQVRKSDFDRIQRWMAMEPVTLEFDLDNRWLGPMPQYNVIADIPGTEKPDEMVIVCGHLDSWNGPGSQGTNDNGTGSAVALETARILNAAGVKPKRTIRFILWSGEEEGLLGSQAYVEKHKDEMPKISAVINDDGGSGYHAGYGITADLKPMMEAAIAPINAAFPDMQVKLNVTEYFEQEDGSDHAPFAWNGVPAFFTDEGGGLDYYFIWHTQNDRIQYSVPRYLVQSATEAASTSYMLAQADALLPRVKLKPEESEKKP